VSEINGTEWLVYLTVRAALHLARARTGSERQEQLTLARNALKSPLDGDYLDRAPFLIRPAKLYELETHAPDDSRSRNDTCVEAHLLDGYTHWTYFPLTFCEGWEAGTIPA